MALDAVSGMDMVLLSHVEATGENGEVGEQCGMQEAKDKEIFRLGGLGGTPARVVQEREYETGIESPLM